MRQSFRSNVSNSSSIRSKSSPSNRFSSITSSSARTVDDGSEGEDAAAASGCLEASAEKRKSHIRNYFSAYK